MIATEYPIYKVLQVWAVGVKDTNGNTHADVDITKFIFEASEYRTLTTSGGYPLGKPYALCYTEGAQNITGLLYKDENALLQVMKAHAIYNILSAACGVQVDVHSTAVVDLAFRVCYVPIVTARVKASKSDLASHATEYVLPFNQTSDRMSAKAFSENLRGTLKRYSAAEKKLSYLYFNLDKLPEVGQKLDDTYYINDMTVSLRNHQYAAVTLGLSKNYNALGKHMSLPSEIRQYEISEKNVQDRYVVVEEYVLVSNDKSTLRKYPAARFAIGAQMSLFYPWVGQLFKYIGANCVMYDENKDVISSVMLPVIALPIANSAVYFWRYKDNYSAGVMSINPDTETAESITLNDDGGWGGRIVQCAQGVEFYRKQREVEYGDLYGEAHSMGFALYSLSERTGDDKGDQEKVTLVGNALPSAAEGRIPNGEDKIMVATAKSMRSITGPQSNETENEFKNDITPIVLHKDSRETICCTYQLNYVGDGGIIIGDGMAKLSLGIRSDHEARSFKVRFYEDASIDEVNGVDPAAVSVGSSTPIALSSGEYIQLSVDGTIPAHASWALRDNFGNFIMGANKPFETVYYRAVASLEQRARIMGMSPAGKVGDVYKEGAGVSSVDGNGLTLSNSQTNAAAIEFYSPVAAVYHIRPTHEFVGSSQTDKYMHLENPGTPAYDSRAKIVDGAFFCLPMKAGMNRLYMFTDGGTYPLHVTDFAIERKSKKADYVFSGKESITFVKYEGTVGSGSRGYQSSGCFALRGGSDGYGSDCVTVDVSDVPNGFYKIGLCTTVDGTVIVNGTSVTVKSTTSTTSGVEYIPTEAILDRNNTDKVVVSLSAGTKYANIGAIILYKIS
jgi:hypothetical protein